MRIATGGTQDDAAVSGSGEQARTVGDLVEAVKAARGRMGAKNSHKPLLAECEAALVWLASKVAEQQDRIESLERV